MKKPSKPATTCDASQRVCPIENGMRPSLVFAIGLFGLASLVSAQETDPTTEPATLAPSEEAEELEEVTMTVTATRVPRSVDDVAIKTEVLTNEDFFIANANNVGQAMELFNGIRTENNCQNCSAAEIQLLGLPGNYNELLIDGQPLFTTLAAVYGIDQIPTVFVDRIEVVKGGGSALYGPGAVSGVINLIPRVPFEDELTVSYDYSSIKGRPAHNVEFLGSLVSPSLTERGSVYGSGTYQSSVDLNDDGYTDLSRYEDYLGGVYGWWNPTERTTLRLNYQYLYEDRRGGNKLDLAKWQANITEGAETNYQWGGLKWDQEVSDVFNFEMSGNFVYLVRDSFYGGTGSENIDPSLVNLGAGTYNGVSAGGDASPDTDQARANTVFGGQIDGEDFAGTINQYGETTETAFFLDALFNYDLGEIFHGNHLLSFGVQYEGNNVKDINQNLNGDKLSTLLDEDFNNVGVFLQDLWEVNPDLEFTVGARLDKANTLDDPVFSPRAAARYTPNEQWILRGSFSTGFLAPQVFNEDFHIGGLGATPLDTINSDGLTEERSYSFSTGFDYFPEVFEGEVATSVQVFYTILEDSFALTPPAPNPDRPGRDVVFRFNTSGSTVAGVEWSTNWQPVRQFNLEAGVAYMQARYDEPQELAEGFFTDHYNKVPDWSGVLQANYINPEFINGFAALIWTGPMKVAREAPEPGIIESQNFFVVDLGISKSWEVRETTVTLKAGVNNVFDSFQDDLQTGPDRDPAFIYGPRLPRSFYLGGEIAF